MPPAIRRTEWDSAVFGVDCFEIDDWSQESAAIAMAQPGHYTVKVDPLSCKRLLHESGFYYCDTLIEPVATAAQFVRHDHAEVSISRDIDLQGVLAICHGAFRHGRYHRDFHLQAAQADQRYDNWLKQVHARGGVYGLFVGEALAGFIAVDGPCLVLHAMAEAYRGKGHARYLWSAVCAELFAAGHKELRSSVSAANLAAVNLYAALGFRFQRAVDVYHGWTARGR